MMVSKGRSVLNDQSKTSPRRVTSISSVLHSTMFLFRDVRDQVPSESRFAGRTGSDILISGNWIPQSNWSLDHENRPTESFPPLRFWTGSSESSLLHNMETFDGNQLRLSLDGVDPRRRVLFAVIIATRMASLYRLYCERRQLGDFDRYARALSFLWNQLAQATPDIGGAEQHLGQVMELIPEEDDDWGELSAQAEDSVSALAYSLRCLITPKPEEAAWAASRAYETVDNLVIQGEDVKLGGSNEAKILADPRIQEELVQQRADLATALTVRLEPEEVQSVFQASLDRGDAFARALAL